MIQEFGNESTEPSLPPPLAPAIAVAQPSPPLPPPPPAGGACVDGAGGYAAASTVAGGVAAEPTGGDNIDGTNAGPQLQPVDGDADDARSPSLYLAIVSFFGDYWLDAHLCLLLALMVPKRYLFVYPQYWWPAEVAFLAFAYGVRRLQRLCCSYGDHAENAGAMAASLALSAPVLLLYGYFTTMQVYILHLEFAAGALSVVLLAAELALTVIGGVVIASGMRQKTLVAVAASLPAASLALVVVPLFTTVATAESFRILLIVGGSFAGASVLVAIVSIGFMLDL